MALIRRSTAKFWSSSYIHSRTRSCSTYSLPCRSGAGLHWYHWQQDL